MRSQRLVALAATAVAALVLPSTAGSPGASAVAVDQRYPVPASGTYTVTGKGFGHGHGMSQYGAEGAARQGLKHEQILAFYYPGTSLETASGKIRVLLTEDTTTDLVVDQAKGLRLRDLGADKLHPLPTDLGATRWRLGVNSAGAAVVSYLAGGRWKRWRPGGAATLVGDGQFRADGPLTLHTPAGASAYRGILRAASPTPGSAARDTVNVLTLDNYVRGVVAREMPVSWSPEAVQSQSVAARTYGAWSRAETGVGRHHDICDTTSCQVYGGTDDEHPLGDAAVAATRRQILVHGGEPAFTQFSSSSGGWTAAGSRPYLVAQKDPYDGWSGNHNHTWKVKLAAAAIAKAYPSIGALKSVRVVARDGNGVWKGRVESMRLVGAKGTVTVSGATFRSRFGLKSSWFTFSG